VTTDPLLDGPTVTDAVPPTEPAVPDLALLDAALPIVTAPDPVSTTEPDVPADCNVTEDRLTALQEPAPAPDIEVFGTPLYLPALDTAARPGADGQQTGSAPPAGATPEGTVPPAPAGNDSPTPWPNGTGLPAPDALPAAPGSGSGNTASSGGPAGGAAWLPSPYLVIPTAGADPIRGPLQHVHSAVAADPGSSPD
jgi:hypothetical protein